MAAKHPQEALQQSGSRMGAELEDGAGAPDKGSVWQLVPLAPAGPIGGRVHNTGLVDVFHSNSSFKVLPVNNAMMDVCSKESTQLLSRLSFPMKERFI